MEKMRPSAQRSTCTPISGKSLRSASPSTSDSINSCVSSQTPSSPLSRRPDSSCLRASQTDSGTNTLPLAGICVAAICSGVALTSPVSLNSTTFPACLRTVSSAGGGSVTHVHSLATIALPRMRFELGMRNFLMYIFIRIDACLEWRNAQAADSIDEAFFRGALLHINIDQALHHVGHFFRRKGRPNHAAKAGIVALLAADADLIPLRTVFIHAQNADMTDTVMAATIHAARDIDFDLADIMQIIKVVKLLLDGLGNRDALGICQRAEIAARAADDVGKQADIGRCQAVLAGFSP